MFNGDTVTATSAGGTFSVTDFSYVAANTSFTSIYGTDANRLGQLTQDAPVTLTFSGGSAPANTLLALFDLDVVSLATGSAETVSISGGLTPIAEFLTLEGSDGVAAGPVSQAGDIFTATTTPGVNADNNALIFDISGLNSVTIIPSDPLNTAPSNYGIGVFTPVPEPSSSALLGLSALGLIARRKR